MITPKITNLGYSNLWSDMSTILGYASNFNQLVKKLFANNEQGFFYDPNDLSTMFQDAAGTVPVTGVGQPVGLMLDKSGRNNHAFQANSASRPILRKNAVTGANYLEFDGSDDFLRTNSIDLAVTDKISLFVGARKLSDVTLSIIAELSSNYNNAGAFAILAPPIAGRGEFSIGAKASGTSSPPYARITGNPAPMSRVLSTKIDFSNTTRETQILIRQNGVDIPSTSLVWAGAASAGSGNFGNYPLYIGRRGGDTAPFNGHIYSLIGVGRLVTSNETTAIEKELAKRTGVTLSV